jgi:LacI family transcriptional regulator
MEVKRLPTIRDVARLAEVSTGTVSRVLNERSGVHPQTRHKVLQAVERLDFKPLAAARELSGWADTIGVMVMPRVWKFSPYFILLFEYLSDALWQEGFKLTELPLDSRGKPLVSAKGYVVLGAHDHDPRLEHIRQHYPQSVLVGVYEGLFWVAPDDPGGAYVATRHLLELGHREIAHVGASGQVGRERYEGYRQALDQARIAYRPELVLDDGEFGSLAAYRSVRRAWERGLRFSALFAASDEMALGAKAALEDLGLRIPQDISLVGFDDLPELGHGLTTVRQDISEIARTVVRLLKAAISGSPPRGERVPVQLVVRETTAKRR